MREIVVPRDSLAMARTKIKCCLFTTANSFHNRNLVSFNLGQLFVAHKTFSFGEKNDAPWQLAVFPRNCTCYSKPRVVSVASAPKGQDSYSSLTEHEKLVFHMLVARLIGSFDSTTFQSLQGSYDKDLHWGTAAFYFCFIKSPGGAEWWKDAGIPFSSACVSNLNNPTPKT